MSRRRKLWTLVTLMTLATGGGIAALALHGCDTPPRLTGTLNVTEQRSRQLTALAAQEAGLIEDIDARLTRQLNLADMQIRRDWPADARTTLTGARSTLESEEASKLNDHARISGWVSVSELSREVKDMATARAACEGAEQAVRTIEDPAVRCEYVMGVANERQYIDGAPVAARLLTEAGPWTQSIDHVERRRQAVVGFASALFNLDDFAAGQQMLRHEPDPAWRSDTLIGLASMDRKRHDVQPSAPQAAEMREESSPRLRATTDDRYFGKQLNYRDVFQGQTNSQTSE